MFYPFSTPKFVAELQGKLPHKRKVFLPFNLLLFVGYQMLSGKLEQAERPFFCALILAGIDTI